MILLNQNIAQARPFIKEETANVIQHFYTQAKRSPFQIAIVEKDLSITYTELQKLSLIHI